MGDLRTGLRSIIDDIIDHRPSTSIYSSVDSADRQKLFIAEGQGTSVLKTELLNKLKNGETFESVMPDSIGGNAIERHSLAVHPNGHVVKIDRAANGEINNNFLSVLNKYIVTARNVENTVQFFQEGKDAKELKQVYMTTSSVESIFNPYFAVKRTGFTTNKPLLDIKEACDTDGFFDTTDCSIWRLLQLSANPDKNVGMGTAVYRLADFMYCKDLGKVSNNHLITLRRYAAPVGDNIFKLAATGDPENPFSVAPDIGRLITWFGTDDNKLSDILKMSFAASWREMNAEIQEVESQGAGDGIFGMIANTLNPQYNKAQGVGTAGGNNLVAGLMSKISIGGVNFGKTGQYEKNHALTNYDKHKIYEPKNTIQSNHYYEGKLTFNNEFTLNFSYKLRSYGSLNQKSVMLDLINNILRVTYTKGKFWGGDVKWIGPPGNNSVMKKMHAFVDDTFDKLAGFTESLINGGIDWQSMLGSLSDAAGNMLNSAGDAAKQILNGNTKDAEEKMKNYSQQVAEFIKKAKVGDAIKGQLKNALGRPAMYAISSFVSGEDLGLWHVTVGNPLNPIAVIGNLIVTNTELSFADAPLGLDDFPTELKVSVTLKHCRPRDMVGIGHMFTRGETGLALPIGQTGWEQFHTGIDPGRDNSGKRFNSDSYNDPVKVLNKIVSHDVALQEMTEDTYIEYSSHQKTGKTTPEDRTIVAAEQT